MPTNTSGGTTTSLDNTPQAKDDFFWASEDQVYTFDVMANDLGGNAKVLWSIDNTSDDGSGDLVAKDVAGVGEYSELGASIWIEAGKVKYDTSALDWLAAGQTVTDQFTYAIRLANGTLSWATVTVTLTGTNDAPVISVGSGDSDAASLTETNAGLTASGTLTVVDADTADVVDSAVTGLAVSGNQGAISSDDLLAMLALTGGDDLAANSGDANNLGWAFNSGAEAFNHLAAGQTLTLTYTLTSSDGHGGSDTQTVTITVTGTNDGPVANADAGAGTENQMLTIDVLANDTDVDDGAVLSLVSATAPAGKGTAGVVAGQLQFDPGTDFDHLAAGATEVVVVDYTIEDEHGATAISTVTITVTGTNDAPVAVDDTGAGDEDSLISGSVAPNDSDVDDGAVLSYSVNGAAPAGFAMLADGSWSLDAANAAYQHLAAGATTEVVVGYTVDDGLGGSDVGQLTVTVTGVNDAPVAQAAADAVVEDATISGNVGATDADDGALLTYALVDSAPAGLTFNPDGSYSFDASSYDYLAAGEPLVLTIPFTASDGLSTSAPADLVITVTGTNDAAVVTGATSGSVTEDTPPGTASGDLDSTDVDGTADSWTAVTSPTLSTNGFGTFLMTAAGAWTYLLDDSHPDVDALDNGETLSDSFTVMTSDGTAQVVNVTINGKSDVIVVTQPPVFTGTGDPNDFDTLVGTGAVNNSATINGGNSTHDNITGGSADQNIDGKGGNDTIYGGGGADAITGNSGDDILYGQTGNDSIDGVNGLDTVYGGSGDDDITGGNDGDILFGGSGADAIAGSNGDDILIGGYGADTLTGGGDSDTFRYLSVLDTGDLITDFLSGTDFIDLSALDSDPSTALNDAFGWGGTTATANGIWYAQDGTNTVIYADTDGNVATAEFAITLQLYDSLLNPLQATDFVM